MKISTKILKAFNEGKESSFNENLNKIKGYPSLIERAFLRKVKDCFYGMLDKKVTQKDIKEFLEINDWKPSKALLKHAEREGLKI